MSGRDDLQATVLVINAGSSSIKYRLQAMPAEGCRVGGLLEGIGGDARLHHGGQAESVRAPDHATGMAVVFDRLQAAGVLDGVDGPMAIGHRVVHGGARFHAPTRIDDEVIAGLEAVEHLAPLHNAANLEGIRAARQRLPTLPQVAVFDTAFHHALPGPARHYALPLALQRELGIRRHGFHGLSHQYVAQAAADRLGRELADTKLITLHLGHGASACAIRGGRSVDTSMGYTPLEGLVMGTRCGDLDPALPARLAELTQRTPAEVERLLQTKSGLQGLCGDSDMRRIEQRMTAGDTEARLAFELFCYRVRKYIGAYFAVLNGIDALVFTAGIGQRSAAVRAAVCAQLDALGIAVDAGRNAGAGAGAGIAVISRPGAPVPVLVIPTDEERQIAEATLDCLTPGTGASVQRPGPEPDSVHSDRDMTCTSP